MSIRFTQLEQQAVPFTSMRETPRAYCDDLYRMAKLAFLNMMMNLVAGNPALLSQGQNFDSGNSIAQIPAILTTSSEALQEPISIQPMQYHNQHAKVLVATVQRENESGSIGSNPTNPIAGVIKTVVQECTLFSKKTLVIK